MCVHSSKVIGTDCVCVCACSCVCVHSSKVIGTDCVCVCVYFHSSEAYKHRLQLLVVRPSYALYSPSSS